MHALTDVTGFGLAGHLLEMCRGAKVQGQLQFKDIPLIPEAIEFARQNVVTGASERNWTGFGADVHLAAGIEDWQKNLLTDPQTSGGLLLACAPESEQEVLDLFKAHGFDDACVIGHVAQGSGVVVS